MAFKSFTVAKWGPKKLREILESIQNAINDRAPKAGLGIDVDAQPDGAQISSQGAQLGGGTGDSAVGGGTSQDVYGAFNGAPAVFHLLRTRAPTVPPP